MALERLGFRPERLHRLEACAFRREAVFRQPALDMGEAALEFGVGGAQRRLRVSLEMPREIDRGEQKIADLTSPLRASGEPPPAISASTSRIPREACRAPRRRRSSRSRPGRPSSCSFSARVSPGKACGNVSERALRARRAAGRRWARASARSCFSCALICPQSALDRRGIEITRSPENMRMASDQLRRDRLDDAAEIERPASSAMRAWKTTCSSRSPSSSRKSSVSPRSIASATS